MMFSNMTYRIPFLTWLFAILFFGCSFLKGQTFYSVRENYLQSKSPDAAVTQTFKNAYPDTSISDLAFFTPRNYGGNIGLPSAPYLFQRQNEEAGFIFFQPFFNSDRLRTEDVRYYRSAGPYAELTGIAGTGKLQMFRLLFTHTPKDKLNITFRLNQYTSDGFYKRQQGRMSNLFFSSNYEAKNKRSGYYFYVLHNGINTMENGGIRDTFLTEQTALQTKSLLSVRLSSATRINKQSRVEFQPYFRLNKTADTTKQISHFLSLKSSFESQSFRYLDRGLKNDGFYDHFFQDSLVTNDSATLRQFRNGIHYHLKDARRGMGLELGFRNEVSQLWQQSDQIFANNSVQTKAYFNPSLKDSLQSLSLQASAWQVLSGYNKGDVSIQSEAAWRLHKIKNVKLLLAGGFENRRPDQQFLNWQSNSFRWQEGFSQQQKTEIELGFQWNRIFRLSVLRQHINNLLYFNESALPAQWEGLAKNTAVTFGLSKVIFRHLGLFAEYRMQTSTAAEVLRFPGSVTTGRIFYSGNLAKNKMQLNFGAQIQWYQSFTPYAYMPATQLFYLQSQVRTTDFPFVDLYLSGRIRPVSFFLKAENILANLLGNTYFLQVGYYQPDAAIRLGITWMFFD